MHFKMAKDFLPTNTFFILERVYHRTLKERKRLVQKPTVFITICIYQAGIEIQMRAKASLEGKCTKEELRSMDRALAIKIKSNHKEIVEEHQRRLQSQLMSEDTARQKLFKRRPQGLINLSTKGYPYSTLPTGHNPDLQTTQSKWRDEPDKKYKYYW